LEGGNTKIILRIYITPLQETYSLRYPIMMLSVITNENVTSARKAMHSKLEESPVVGPSTHVEPGGAMRLVLKWGSNIRRPFQYYKPKPIYAAPLRNNSPAPVIVTAMY
jgi:hypothetical protein